MMTAGEIANLLSAEIKGDPSIEIKAVRGLDDAGAGDISYIAGKRNLLDAERSGASCFIVGEFADSLMQKVQLRVKDPQQAFAALLGIMHKRPSFGQGIDTLARVSENASVAEDASISAFSVIARGASVGMETQIAPFVFIGENSSIGDGCIIHPGVTIMDGVRIGNRVIIHAGTVIGSDGFGYIQREGRNIKVPQVGGVVIGDDVEIGACVTIDRATTGNTTIGKGTKIDNLVQIAHNVTIGENSIIVAQVGIAGSSKVGNYVVLGGQVGVADHVTIEDGTMVAAQSGVADDLKKGAYGGTPAISHRGWLKSSVVFGRLPELQKKLFELEGAVKKITGGQ